MHRYLLAIVLSVLSSITVSGQPTAEEISRYPHQEAELVYQAVLDEIFRSDGSPRTIVVFDSLGHALARVDTLTPGRPGYPPGFEEAALRNFLRVTSTPFHPHSDAEFALAPFPRFLYPVPISRVTGAMLKTFSASRHTDTLIVMRNGTDPMLIEEEPFWTAFRKQFPDTWGFTVLTRVGFNHAATHAFVQIMHRCYTQCTSIESVFLRKTDNLWVVDSRLLHPEESVEGFPPGQLRYLGRGAWMRAANARFEAKRKIEIADSLRREHAPRRIRGVLVNARSGRGMAGHPVYQLLGRDGNPDRVAVTDKDGRFIIENAAVGGWYLSVQCDEQFGVYRSVKDAGFYLGPGVDTTIVFEVRSLAPCWKRRIHPLQSGEQNSPAYAKSPFPGDHDAGIYEAVINELFPSNVKRPLLVSKTTGRCSLRTAFCDGYEHLAVLVREGLVDSAAFRVYTGSSQPSVRFNTAFARSQRLRLLTPAILSYLAQEADAARPDQNSYWEEDSQWYGLVRAYPDADGIISFTRAVFNADSTEAFISALHQRGLDDELLKSFVLERAGSAWRIAAGNLEAAPITARFVDGTCVIARGGSRLPRSEHSRLQGMYRFTFAGTNGIVQSKQLDVSHFLSWHPEDRWDGSLDHKLLNIRTSEPDNLFGTWQEVGSHAVPVDAHGNQIPEMSGHFCASRLSH